MISFVICSKEIFIRSSLYAYLMSLVAYGPWGGGGTYSYVCVYRPLKQLTSKEIDCAEHEYNYEYVPPLQLLLSAIHH